MALKAKHKQLKASSSFFGREAFLKIFEEELALSSSKEFSVLMYYGIGGIGKTTLQKELLRKSKDEIAVYVNLEQNREPQSFYGTLKKSLSKQIKFFYFDIAFAIYWEKLNPNIKLSKENLPFLDESGMLWDALGVIDGLGALGMGSGVMSLINKYAKKVNYQINAECKDELHELESLEVYEIEELLPKFFAYDIEKHYQKNPDSKYLFFIDTHEVLYENIKKESKILESDLFLRELILSLEDMNALFVITGREKLKWRLSDEEWNDYIHHTPLSEFTPQESRLFLDDNSITDERLIESIIEHSQGVPFYLKLSVDTYKNSQDIDYDDFEINNTYDLFERFFRYLDKAEASIIKILSLTKYFDKELFGLLNEKFHTGFAYSDFAALMEYSFINLDENGNYTIHSLMRQSVEQTLDSELKSEIEEFLFTHYGEKIDFDTAHLVSDEEFKNFSLASYYKIKLHPGKEDQFYNWFRLAEKQFLRSFEYRKMVSVYKSVISTLMYESYINKLKLKLGFLYIELEQFRDVKGILTDLKYQLSNKNDLGSYNHLQALEFSAKASLSKENRKRERRFYEHALKYITNDILKLPVLTDYVNHLRKQKELDEAKKYLNIAQAILESVDRNNFLFMQEYEMEFYLKSAYLYKDLKEYAEALRSIERLQQHNENSADERDFHLYYKGLSERFLSTYYYSSGENEKAELFAYSAIKSFDEVLSLNNQKSKSVYSLLARIHIKMDKEIEFENANTQYLLDILRGLGSLQYKHSEYRAKYDAFKNSFRDYILKNREEIIYKFYDRVSYVQRDPEAYLEILQLPLDEELAYIKVYKKVAYRYASLKELEQRYKKSLKYYTIAIDKINAMEFEGKTEHLTEIYTNMLGLKLSYEEKQKIYDAYLQLLEKNQNKKLSLKIEFKYAQTMIMHKKMQDAFTLLEKIKPQLKEYRLYLEYYESFMLIAQCYAQEDKHEQVEETYLQYLDILEKSSKRLEMLRVLEVLQKYFFDLSFTGKVNNDKSVVYLQRYIDESAKSENTKYFAKYEKYHLLLYKFYKAQEEHEKTMEMLFHLYEYFYSLKFHDKAKMREYYHLIKELSLEQTFSQELNQRLKLIKRKNFVFLNEGKRI